MLRLAFDFIITWRETRTRPNAYLFHNIFNFFSGTKLKMDSRCFMTQKCISNDCMIISTLLCVKIPYFDFKELSL